MSSKKILLLIVIIGVSVGGAYWWRYERPVARIGSWEIYRQDVAYRDRIVQLEFPGETRSLGLLQLSRSAVNLAILENNGVHFTPERIHGEEERIATNTRDPEKLAKIKAIFGGDEEAYRRDFVMPTLADRIIYFDFFLTSEKVHATTLRQANEFIDEAVKGGESFADLAYRHHLAVVPVVVSEKEGLKWPLPNVPFGKQATVEDRSPRLDRKLLDKINGDLEKRNSLLKNREALIWINEVISPIKPGQVALKPISVGTNWVVAHYIKKGRDGIYELEVVNFPKISYNDWYETEKAKVLH